MSKKLAAQKIMDELYERLPFVRKAFTVRNGLVPDLEDTRGYWSEIVALIPQLGRDVLTEKEAETLVSSDIESLFLEILSIARASAGHTSNFDKEEMALVKAKTERYKNFFSKIIGSLRAKWESAGAMNFSTFHAGIPKRFLSAGDNLVSSIDDMIVSMTQMIGERQVPSEGDKAPTSEEVSRMTLPSFESSKMLSQYEQTNLELKKALNFLDGLTIEDAKIEEFLKTYAEDKVSKQFFKYMDILSSPDASSRIGQGQLQHMETVLETMSTNIEKMNAAIAILAEE